MYRVEYAVHGLQYLHTRDDRLVRELQTQEQGRKLTVSVWIWYTLLWRMLISEGAYDFLELG